MAGFTRRRSHTLSLSQRPSFHRAISPPRRARTCAESEPPCCVRGLCLSAGISPSHSLAAVSRWRSSPFCLEWLWQRAAPAARYPSQEIRAAHCRNAGQRFLGSCSVCFGGAADTVPGPPAPFFSFLLRFFILVAVALPATLAGRHSGENV